MARVGVIGGSGVYDPEILRDVTERLVRTPYGEAQVTLGYFGDLEVAFLPRHGAVHSIAPHKINYKANIMALKALGVRWIIATTAVGSLRSDLAPGSFLLLDQFIDYTKCRDLAFDEEKVLHLDFTEPYCPELRGVLARAAKEEGIGVVTKGTYVCVEGPRYETPAEVRIFASWGGDVVGMTQIPEVILAKEAEMCYATISTVTNYGAGISPNPLDHKEVVEVMEANRVSLRRLLARAIPLVPSLCEGCGP